MKTTDIFQTNRSSRRLNEGLEKTFGKKLNLENFDLNQLQDARNKLRTQISQVRGQGSFNENIKNEALSQAQFMLDAINAEIVEREEFISDAGVAEVEEGYSEYQDMFNDWMNSEYAPYKDMAGDDKAVMQKAAEYLAGQVPAHELSDIAEILTGMFHGEDGVQTEGSMDELAAELGEIADSEDYDTLYDLLSDDGPAGRYLQDKIEEITGETGLHPKDDFEQIETMLMDIIQQEFGGQNDDEGGETDDNYAMASAGFGSDEDYESVQNEDDVEDFLKAGGKIQHGKPQRGPRRPGLSMASRHIGGGGDKMKPSRSGKAANTQGKPVVSAMGSGRNESVDTGEDMTRLREGEIQQASAIVSAKTMVDRVGRWIEELSGMENDTLLQLGDQIRDEMGQQQAKQFISSVAPAIQQALENLKTTRETLATGVRTLTGEEQPANMLGADAAPEAGGIDDLEGPVEPDTMNAEPEGDIGDEFAAAEPATGGAEAAGREQRESINYGSRLLKVLAG